MEIRIEPHTLERAGERGASKEEIIQTIQFGLPIDAKAGRKAKVLILDFRQERNGKQYEQKKIEVYFIEENKTIITVTVYVFYGKFNN
jgi:hypothetical protein